MNVGLPLVDQLSDPLVLVNIVVVGPLDFDVGREEALVTLGKIRKDGTRDDSNCRVSSEPPQANAPKE